MQRDVSNTNQKESSYDKVLNLATEYSVQNSISLKSRQLIKRQCRDNRWQRTQHLDQNLEMIGTIEHYQELQQIEKQLQPANNSDDDSEREYIHTPKFKLQVRVGDKFPKLKGQVSPFLNNIERLEHVPGEVMIILLVAGWNESTSKTISVIEQMLRKNSANWEGKIRAVVINKPGESPAGLLDDQGNKIVWKLVQHLELTQSEDLIKALHFNYYDQLFMVLDQKGMIQSPLKLYGVLQECTEEVIRDIIEGRENDAQDQTFNEEVTENFDNQRKKLIDKIVQASNTSNDIKLNQIEIETTIKRTFQYGKSSQSIRPLHIKYKCQKQQIEQHQKWINLFTRDLKDQQFQVDVQVDDEEIMQNMYLKKIGKILKMNGINGSPHFQKTYCLNMFDGSLQEVSTQPKFPSLKYKKDCSFRQGVQIQKMIKKNQDNYRQSYNFNDIYPWEVVNSEFFGVQGLYLQKDKSKKNIEKVKGTALIIYQWNDNSKEVHLKTLVQLMQRHPRRLQLHIIAPLFTLLTEYENRHQGIFLYSSKISEDMQAMGFSQKQQSVFYYTSQKIVDLVIVNEQGLITQTGRWEKMRQMDIDEYLMPKKPIGQSLAAIIEQLADSPIGQEVTQFIQRCRYQAVIQIIFSKDVSDQTKITNAKLEIKIRESDKKQVEPLIQLLRPEGVEIEATYYKTVDIPEGKECAECNETLSFPYYYFPWSKVHRCLECTEAEDYSNRQKMKRFHFNENAVLIFAPNTNVDLKRLGTNCQAKSEYQWNSFHFGFMCDSCRGGSQGRVRYICMGCKREPNPNDYVDFCYKCAKKLTGNNEQRQQVLARCPNHTEHHPLLRMLYGSGSYYDL